MEYIDFIKKFYDCPNCGRAISGEKRSYFVCPECGKTLCEESKLADFNDKYCGNCGTKITSARDEVLALVMVSDKKLENWISVNLPENCKNVCISFKREIADIQIKQFEAKPLYGFNNEKEDWLPVEVFITYGGVLAPNQKHLEA